MKFPATLLGLAIAAVSVSACSDNAQQESSEAANAIGSDVERTGEEAAAATERTAEEAGAAADRAAERAGAAADRVGRDISEGADAAADATGRALENTGQAIRD